MDRFIDVGLHKRSWNFYCDHFARGCTDGRKKCRRTTKEKTSFPTVRKHSLFLTEIIAALEGRKVVTVEIPGAFMQTDIDEPVHAKLEDELIDVILMVEEKCTSSSLTKRERKSFVSN
jgi:hypothetical protein